jgi:hypothetical protein
MHEKKWKYELMYLAENDCSSTVFDVDVDVICSDWYDCCMTVVVWLLYLLLYFMLILMLMSDCINKGIVWLVVILWNSVKDWNNKEFE